MLHAASRDQHPPTKIDHDSPPGLRRIVRLPDEDETYVIGDVHGCANELRELIASLPLGREARLVFVGDYIDRGPDSRGVIETILELSQRYVVHALMGNHEASLLDFVDQPESALAARFLLNGGGATLQSYVTRPGAFLLPDSHLELVRSLLLAVETPRHFIVHAGLPNVPIAALDDVRHGDDILWIRRPFLRSHFQWEKVIVHGHTPCEEIEIGDRRINVDTGCVFDNKLTAIRLSDHAVFQVPKHDATEHIYLADAEGSRRRAVRFDGVVSVFIFDDDGVALPFETVNYNDFGALVREITKETAAVRFEVGDRLRGRVEASDADTYDFVGRIVRVEALGGLRRVALQFDAPPRASR